MFHCSVLGRHLTTKITQYNVSLSSQSYALRTGTTAFHCLFNKNMLTTSQTLPQRRLFSSDNITSTINTETSDLDALRRHIQSQGIRVRELKQSNVTSSILSTEVEKLKSLKAQLKLHTDIDENERLEKQALRTALDDLLLRKFFYVPSYEIYGGVSGLYDYGPPGCALMANLQNYWRKHFVLTENMLEVSCSSLTPEIVLKTSGHVDRFTDLMVTDTITKDYYRADKLLEEVADKLLSTEKAQTDPVYAQELQLLHATAGAFGVPETMEAMKKYNITSPNGNPLSDPVPFNLMFTTSIGPTGKYVGYLRPETAQGIFVNFRRLYEYNNHRLPFGAAQIGLAYRNEIAPRAGLIRVREFPLAEIEHFVNPNVKDHVRFNDVINYPIDLLPNTSQDGVNTILRITTGEAVEKGIIDNQTLAYFMARTHMFLVDCGVDPARLRFRQHLHTEMAHYATDCWDAEILTTQGWIECVGHADRSAYDLKVHSNASGVDLIATEALEKAEYQEKYVARFKKAIIGRKYKHNAAFLMNKIETMDQENLDVLSRHLELSGNITLHIDIPLPQDAPSGTIPEKIDFELTHENLSIMKETEKISSISYTPSVIEPSFGLGRIIYSLLEHAYYVRDGDLQRKVLRLSPIIAPVKVGIYNAASNIPYGSKLANLRTLCINNDITFQEDTSKTSIGRKYSRGDEIGMPFAISLDAETCAHEGKIGEELVVLRERDSMEQVQVSMKTAIELISQLCKMNITWSEVYEKYPKFIQNLATVEE